MCGVDAFLNALGTFGREISAMLGGGYYWYLAAILLLAWLWRKPRRP